MVVVVVLADSFRGIGEGAEALHKTQQSGHAPRPEPKVKNGNSIAKDGTPERLRRRTIQKEVS